MPADDKTSRATGPSSTTTSATTPGASAGSSPSQQLAGDLSRHLYEMARLAVGGLEPSELAGFQQRSTTLMGQLMERGL